MRLMTVVCGVVIGAAVVLSAEAAQRPTIPQMIEAARPRTPQWRGRVRELAPRPFEEMVAASDLIVVGSLRKLRTYLSPDETVLYTDFEVVPTTTVAARTMPSSPGPGQQTIVLRQWGGTTVINGVKVEMQDEDLSLLPTEIPLLLLLTFNSEVQKYEVFEELSGAFALEGGRRLKHLATTRLQTYQSLQGMDIEAVVSEIRRLGRQ